MVSLLRSRDCWFGISVISSSPTGERCCTRSRRTVYGLRTGRLRFYYEVVAFCRRISFTVIAAFVRANGAAQVSIAFLFAVVFVFISDAVPPFQNSADTMLYRWGNGVIVASMYVAFLTKVDVGEEKKQYALLTFSGVLILANVFMVVAVLVEMVFLAKQVRGMNSSVREVDRPVRRTDSMAVRGVR